MLYVFGMGYVYDGLIVFVKLIEGDCCIEVEVVWVIYDLFVMCECFVCIWVDGVEEFFFVISGMCCVVCVWLIECVFL